MFPMSIVQIHSKLTMKNRNNMVSKIKLFTLVILTISMFSCGNKAENPIEQSNINPDIKINMVVVSNEYFKFKGGKYYIQKSLNKSTGNKTFFDKVKEINAIDSTDNLPNIELGEYRFIEIEFVADNYVNLKLASFSVNKDLDYNVKKNWINKCEIVDGSKSIFDKGGNIKLKCLNCEESDLSQSVLLKGIGLKKYNADPQKSTYIIKTTDLQIVCNKKEIFWERNYNHDAEFSWDAELKEVIKAYSAYKAK